jgi:hypothetical protein
VRQGGNFGGEIMKITSSLFALPAIVLTAILMPLASAQEACDAVGTVEFNCGLTNPEDLVLLPGTDWIVSSGMAAGSSFYLIDSTNREWSALANSVRHDSAMFPRCSSPPTAGEFESHGLSIRAGTGGRSTLYVVGHGAREAIEVFDVDASGARPTLAWKGCVLLPEGLAANSVASFADGGMVGALACAGRCQLERIRRIVLSDRQGKGFVPMLLRGGAGRAGGGAWSRSFQS